MCFAHSGTPSDALHVQAGVGTDAAEAFAALAEAGGLGSTEITGSGTPDAVVAPRGERVLDGFSRVLHNRWNRDLNRSRPMTVTWHRATVRSAAPVSRRSCP